MGGGGKLNCKNGREEGQGQGQGTEQIKTKQGTAKPSKIVDASTQGTTNQIQIHSVFELKARD